MRGQRIKKEKNQFKESCGNCCLEPRSRASSPDGALTEVLVMLRFTLAQGFSLVFSKRAAQKPGPADERADTWSHGAAERRQTVDQGHKKETEREEGALNKLRG